MPHDVFISYSSHDKVAADAACAALEASGVRCWIAPRDITPGTEWGEAIIGAINQCRAMVLIFSANANDSPQIRREVERAVSKGVSVIPLRIQDIEPAHSLEYFIGTVHWLDALTPPLEGHLLRLAESVKTLLQIDPLPPRIVSPPKVHAAGSRVASRRFILATIGLAVLVAAGAGFSIWWQLSSRDKAATQPSPQPGGGASPSPAAAKAEVEPDLVGTFEHTSVIDDYDWRFVYTIAANGTYDLIMTENESGTFRGSNGQYRTVADKTGRVRTGTYRALGSTAVEVTSATGTVIFQPAQSNVSVDPANPVILGLWHAVVVKDGLTWTLTIQNNPDGTYHFEARAEDKGACLFADRQWRTVSAVTGQSVAGIFRVIDARNIELTSMAGPAIWQRQ
jgi:hypothetical protein